MPVDGTEQQALIRPAAVLPETATRTILMALADNNVRQGGVWDAVPGQWRRFDAPWGSSDGPGEAELMGTVWCIYDQPTRYSTTLYRVTVTPTGLDQGWTTDTLCDDALGFAGLTLAECPRASLPPPPPSFFPR